MDITQLNDLQSIENALATVRLILLLQSLGFKYQILLVHAISSNPSSCHGIRLLRFIIYVMRLDTGSLSV